MPGKIISGFFMWFSFHYISFVYKTSKIIINGDFELLDKHCPEKFIIAFWHGDGYCYYPLLKDRGVLAITTANRRGDYVSGIIERFGYIPLRVPDESDGNNQFLKIREQLNSADKRSLALTLDGPLGPYHVPKKFAVLTAVASKRRIITLSVKARRKINITSRWDNYMIPLPFSKIEFFVNGPIEVKKRGFDEISAEILELTK